ncbi:YggS family pyridoxal phosphate-dependent enzyme [bacterium]|nr:YggS family pyridoxal phosphate-dependent enzyme [bacterium]
MRNLDAVRGMLNEAASAAGRRAPNLVAVTKAVDDDIAAWVLDAGCRDLGENRADAFARRAERFASAGLEARWHFIGHLQRNKVRRVLEHVHVLHSVDSERLADAVARVAEELGRQIDVFIQVNLTGEDEKHGFGGDEAAAAALRLAESPAISVRGLMAMGPLRSHRTAREVFEEARELARSLEDEVPEAFHQRRCELSMGMSGDAALATELGSDLVRVGSALFVDLPHPATLDQAPQPPLTTDALKRAEDD